MNTTEPYSLSLSNGNKDQIDFYDGESDYSEITDIIRKISNRTLEIKTTNIKLLNSINSEVGNLMLKADQLTKICLKSRNDFIKEIESLQMNFLELTKKVDEKFLNLSNSNKNKKITISKNDINEGTNLKKLLQTSTNSVSDDSSNNIIGNDNDDDDDDHDEIIQTNNKNQHGIQPIQQQQPGIKTEMKSAMVFRRINQVQIPDTCFENKTNDKENGYMKSNGRLIIRDTIDSVNCYDLLNEEESEPLNQVNNLSTINESPTNEKKTDEFNEKSKPINKDLITKHFALTNQSTPLSVKKKLQEHGLLDMTNSPSTTNIASLTTRSKSKEFNMDRSQSIINKPTTATTPTKYIQRQFEPLIESPNQKKDKTPTKLILITPTKSNDHLMKKSSSVEIDFKLKTRDTPIKATSNETTNVSETPTKQTTADDSLDFSFEFRQQQQQKKQQSQQKNTSQKTQSTVNLIPKSIPKSASNKNIFSQKLTNSTNKKTAQSINPVDIPSPNKNNNLPAAKRFKQLTMTQAFSITQEPVSTNKNLSSKMNDLDETCLPESLINHDTNVNNDMANANGNAKNNKELTRIKLEPEDNVGETTADCRVGFNLKQKKNDNDLDSEFFSDYDKVPKKQSKSPNYKHIQVVRKHDERKKLNSAACKECENYWNSLPEELRTKRMDEICRHRFKYQAPATPEHYWSIAFPTTQECIERGYGGVIAQSEKEDPVKRPRRKRPLKLITNKDVNNETNNENDDLNFGD